MHLSAAVIAVLRVAAYRVLYEAVVNAIRKGSSSAIIVPIPAVTRSWPRH